MSLLRTLGVGQGPVSTSLFLGARLNLQPDLEVKSETLHAAFHVRFAENKSRLGDENSGNVHGIGCWLLGMFCWGI